MSELLEKILDKKNMNEAYKKVVVLQIKKASDRQIILAGK